MWPTNRKTGNVSRSRLLPVVLFTALGVAVVGGVAIAAKFPFTEKAARRTLERRFGRQVSFRHFQKNYFPPGFVAEEVELPPLATVSKLIVRGSYAGMLPFNKHIPQVEAIGLHLKIPSKSAGGPSAMMPSAGDSSVTLNDVHVDGAVIEWGTDEPGRQPFTIAVHHLVLDNIGGNGPITYHASIRNSEPPGEIHAAGKIGPWNFKDPGATPVSGAYDYRDADLGMFGGISGKLSAEGKFTGTLARVNNQGTLDIVAFHVAGAKREVHVSSQYRMHVDARTGDTILENVRAGFLHTSVVTKGSVTGKPGKTANLELTVDDGHVDDLLSLFTARPRPAMSGRIGFRARAEVPPGPAKFLVRLRMQGDFGIAGGRFTNAAIQKPIDRVSESARGESKQQEREDPSTVLSNLRGHVSVSGGIATLSRVSFAVPGGSARMEGTFQLLTKAIDIHGTLYTDGKLSDGADGFKALVIKAVTPFLKKKSLTVVPFAIDGTSRNPNFTLDFARKKKF